MGSVSKIANVTGETFSPAENGFENLEVGFQNPSRVLKLGFAEFHDFELNLIQNARDEVLRLMPNLANDPQTIFKKGFCENATTFHETQA
jgi:hypothetical protein